MINSITELFERDLLKLRDELNNFKNEENLWRKADGITNTAGNLALHLIGNLNYHVGALLGNTGYVRNREQEFTLTGVAREKMLTDIEDLIKVLKIAIRPLLHCNWKQNTRLNFMAQKARNFTFCTFTGISTTI